MTCISPRQPPKRNSTASVVSLPLSLTASLQAAAQAAVQMSVSCAPRSPRPKGTVRGLERWPRPALLLSCRVYKPLWKHGRQHDSLHRRECDRNHILHHAENDNVEEHGGGGLMIIV